MASGRIGMEMDLVNEGTVSYQRTAADIGVMQGRFLRGPHEQFVLCSSETAFKSRFGEVFLPGFELDFEVALSYFRSSGSKGRLLVRNVFYYGATPDADFTVAKAVTADLASCTLGFMAQDRGDWAHAGQKNLQVIIRDTIQRRDGSGFFDVVVKYNGKVVKTYLNMSFSSLEERFVQNVIPIAGDGYIIPVHRSGIGMLNPPNGTYQFTNGNNGLTGADPIAQPLAAKHWLGEAFAGLPAIGQNTGLYGLSQFLSNVNYRPTFIINQLANENYEWDNYSNLTTFCNAFWLTHFSTPPSGKNRTQVFDWVVDTDTGGVKQRITERGEARVCWPWIYPRNCANKALIIPACGADAGRMVARIHSSGGHVHEAYVGTDNGQGSLALSASNTEWPTCADDRDTLNPLGVCVISTDLGGIYLDGSRTMTYNSKFLEMSTRRHLAVIIAAGILAQSRWMLHGLNDKGYENSPGIWERGTLGLRSFMSKYASDGAFTSKSMGALEEGGGWVADLGEPWTTPADVADRVGKARVGYSPRSCAEFIFFGLAIEDGNLTATA